MNREHWLRIPGYILFFGLITSCGGGGGGGGNDGLLTYTGSLTPAVLNPANVVEITEMAIYSAADASSLAPDITGGELSAAPTQKIARAARLSRAGIIRATVAEDHWTETGTCGGTMNISIRGDDETGEFSAFIDAKNYCEEGETLDGEIEISGHFDNEMMDSMTIDFNLVTFRDAEDNFTISGTVTEDSPVTTMTMNYRDNLTSKVYRFLNYVISTTYIDQGFAESVSGRFYHPDHGYVDVATVTPFTFAWDDDVPHSGSATCTGASGIKSRFTALSAAAYTIAGDFDNDGAFDDFSTGVVHYPGRNTQPTISAGNDFSGNVGCGVMSVSGATATDADTDPLTRAWTFVARPAGSGTNINGADTLTPSFNPDLPGQYVLQLSVSDGIGDNVIDTVTATVYGDLFCLNAKTFIPAAPASKPAALAIGDVTGDGWNDVVFLTASAERVDSDPTQDYHLSVFAQTAQGSLTLQSTYPAGDGSSLAIADFNSDGRKDVAVSTRTGVGIFYQNLQGTFGTMQLLPFGETIDSYEPHSMVAADFTGDGRVDLASVYSTFTSAKIRLYPQNGAGAFATPTLFTTDPGYWVAKAADINGDLKTDLVLTSHEWGKGSVYLGAFAKHLLQSTGTLNSPATYLFDNSLSPDKFCSPAFALAKLNGDNRPDLVTSCSEVLNQSLPFLRLYPQRVDRTLGSPDNFTAPTSYSQLEAVDLTGDTLADLIGIGSWNQIVFEVFRQGGGGPGSAESYPVGTPSYNYSTQAFAVGDVNSDNYPDIVTAVFAGYGENNGLLVVPGNPNRQ